MTRSQRYRAIQRAARLIAQNSGLNERGTDLRHQLQRPMLTTIRGYFGMDGAEDVSLLTAQENIRVAIATVLLSAAFADSTISPAERDVVMQQLDQKLGIPPAKARLLEGAVELHEDRRLVEQYTGMLMTLSVAQREQILSLAWGVLSADDSVVEEETSFALKLRSILGLSLEQSMRARKLGQSGADGFKEAVEANVDVQNALQEQLQNLRMSQKPR